ncbi:hypothetical protein SAMN05192575_10558 [Nocardioides alpinus]|uniref:Sulfotransferase family protein n=1 Tax=Nocardioides alpinus TaxID=748909 RepID=A0A1I0Z8W4_9ACTN|nr:hypothetical protein [Nocardioides alpinus]PKH38288.1 hypothetical protein CXG46_16160 [Nocardioides alpinus]SFB21010.1 hypothetical protein SAMN05192575_10558 [Nocardioides alpinus]
MSRRVLLHVGCPKTGTSYLQDVLFRNQATLREHDILYPADRFDAHFLAALDLMTLPWGGLETEAVGSWDRLSAEVRDWHGTSIISHEIFARATPTQVERALASLGDAEVHLVLSVRDLVRQIPAEWQENVKHRSHITYARFLETVRDPGRESKIGSWFWAVQEVPDILDRWGASLPAEHVHLVTVPPSGSDRGELWRRFSHTFGLDDLPLDLTAERENPSLGVPETSLLRTINQRVTSILSPPDYRPLVRELLAHQTLSRSVASARLGLAPDDHAWAQDLSRSWVALLAERGYDVAGSLDDLLGPDLGTFADPDTASAEVLLPPALDAIGALLVEAARLRAVEERLHEELREAHEERDRARMTTSYKVRRKVVTTLEDSPAGRGTLDAYRRMRGRG